MHLIPFVLEVSSRAKCQLRKLRWNSRFDRVVALQLDQTREIPLGLVVTLCRAIHWPDAPLLPRAQVHE